MSAATETRNTRRPMNNSEIVGQLRKEASSNPVFNAICHVFAVRERARHQVTLSSLRITLAKEGFFYKPEQIIACFKFLADLGVGRIEKNASNRTVALKDVTLTLQSIGKCALAASDESLKKFREQRKFVSLNPEITMTEKKDEKPKDEAAKYPVSIVTTINGEEINVPLSTHMTAEQILALFDKIKQYRNT